MAHDVVIVPFDDALAAGVADVCRALRWPSYSDEQIALRGCAAPGVTTVVAVDTSDSQIVGFAQVLSDGVVQAYLAQVGVLEPFRRLGIARRLVAQAFDRCGAQRLDLLTDDAEAFYQSFSHKRKIGFRIYPASP